MEEINISPKSDFYMTWHTLQRVKVQTDDGIALMSEVISRENQELSEQEEEALREIVRRTGFDLVHLYEELKHSGAREVINRHRFSD